MTEYGFTGDMDNISERQMEFINEVIKEHGWENSQVSFELLGKPGDNYSSNVKRITIEGDHGCTKIIAKFAPSIEIVRKIANTGAAFRNEHIIYTKVLPKFVELQKSAQIPEDEQFKFTKCYGSLSEELNEVILLQDMIASDYKMLDRFESLSDEYVKSALKNLAFFHCLSFALRHREKETYDHFKNTLTDMSGDVANSPVMQTFFQALEDVTVEILEDTGYADLVRHKIENSTTLQSKFSKMDKDSQYTVILHGDAWTNNFMFNYDNNQIQSVLLDYQQCRNSSPVWDIMFMIFNCTDHELRKQHYNDWTDYYHSELEQYLSLFNLRANLIYSRDKLDADMKRFGKLMFGVLICFASVLTRKSEDAAKFEKMGQEAGMSENYNMIQEMTAAMQQQEDTKALFKGKIVGLIESFLEFGLL